MPLKFGGYTCDRCNIIVIPSPLIANSIRDAINHLPERSILRIYCPVCSEIKQRVEQTMLLKDTKEG